MRTLCLLLALGCTGGSTPDPTDGTDPTTDPTDPGTLEDGQMYRLTIVMDMIWDEGTSRRTTKDCGLQLPGGRGPRRPLHDWLVGTIGPRHRRAGPRPHECMGELLGDGHVDMTGSGTTRPSREAGTRWSPGTTC